MSKPVIPIVDDDAEVLKAIERDLRQHYRRGWKRYWLRSGHRMPHSTKAQRFYYIYVKARRDPLSSSLMAQCQSFARHRRASGPKTLTSVSIQMRALLLSLVSIASWAATPQRIISTAPSITETLFAIGAGPRVAAVTVYCRYPPEVRKLPKIGTYLTADVEAISALHPDLVVVEKQPNNLVQQLKLLKIPEIEVKSGNLEEVYEGAMAMGKATGTEEAAAKFVTSTKTALANIHSQTSALPHPTAVFLIGHTPGRLQGLIAGANGSYFSDLLTIVGAKDILADSVAPYPQVTLEEIVSRNPDLILEMSGDTEKAQAEAKALWQSQTTLRAVKDKHIYAVPSGPFEIPGPRVIEATRLLLHLVHPEIQP